MLDKAAESDVNFIDIADICPPGAEAGGAEIIVGAGSARSGENLSSPQRAAERWAQPLGVQAIRENTYSTRWTLPCAA